MKRIYIMLAAFLVTSAVALAGCGTGPAEDSADDQGVEESGDSEGAAADFTGSAMELLEIIISEADAMPEVVIDDVTAENAPAMLGLLADDFVSYIADAAAAVSESGEVAFQAAIVNCMYADDAGMIDELIRESFDPGKWVSVFPDRALTSVSRPYILLAAGSQSEVGELSGSFEKAVGGAALTTVFYEGETGG